jgi:ribose-phosphate pyrophosphokinase
MKIQVINGPFIGYTPFIFPDGQRHITLEGDVAYSEVVITTSLCSADDLFDLLLVNDILRHNHNSVHLQIEYLLGGRMDRRINDRQPDTLAVVGNIIHSADFESVSVLDPHSSVTLDVLGAGPPLYAMTEFLTALNDFRPIDTVIVQPDKGAEERVRNMTRGLGFIIVECSKKRESASGRLFKPKIKAPALVRGMRCLIVDDICDGGATFVALARKLREAGATEVSLFVTHGIFSKGIDLEGIDSIYSTGSFTGKVYPKHGASIETDYFCTCTWGGQPYGGIHRENCPKRQP